MKIFLLIIALLFNVSVLASSNTETNLENKIFNKIILAILPKKDRVQVWYYGENPPLALKNNTIVKLVDNCKDADFIILEKAGWKYPSCKSIPIIVLKYSLLNQYNTALGAYFWQKGRPNIVMIEPRIKKFGIKLPHQFDQFIESKVW